MIGKDQKRALQRDSGLWFEEIQGNEGYGKEYDVLKDQLIETVMETVSEDLRVQVADLLVKLDEVYSTWASIQIVSAFGGGWYLSDGNLKQAMSEAAQSVDNFNKESEVIRRSWERCEPPNLLLV
jgi:hypothetical protein